MHKQNKSLVSAPAALAAAALIAAPPALLADDDSDEIPFDVAHVFFELNNTDGDLGIHSLVDGGPWKKLEIEDPNEREILDIAVKGRLRRQGLTEIFFESAEPTFDELSPRQFFRRFPAGIYEVEGLTLDGVELENEVELSHVMPAPPQAGINGNAMALQCDDEEPGYDAPEVSSPITVSWPAITMSHPDADGGGAGVQPPVPVAINNYEVVLEVETEDEFEATMTFILPPGQTSVTIPEDFVALGDEFKYEVLAREANYNQTASESCFLIAGGDE